MKKPVKLCHPLPLNARLDMFEKRGKPADHPPLRQRLSHPIKLFQINPGFNRPPFPRRLHHFVQTKFSLQYREHFPLMRSQFDRRHRNHFRRRIPFVPRLQMLPPHMTNPQRKNAFRWHQTKRVGPDEPRKQLAMIFHPYPRRHLERCPQLERRPRDFCFRGPDDNMTGKRIVFEQKIESRIHLFCGHPPRHKRAIRQIGRDQRLPDPAHRPGFKHRPQPLKHGIQRHPRTLGYFRKWLARKPLDLIFGYCQYLSVDRIGMANGYHGWTGQHPPF